MSNDLTPRMTWDPYSSVEQARRFRKENSVKIKPRFQNDVEITEARKKMKASLQAREMPTFVYMENDNKPKRLGECLQELKSFHGPIYVYKDPKSGEISYFYYNKPGIYGKRKSIELLNFRTPEGDGIVKFYAPKEIYKSGNIVSLTKVNVKSVKDGYADEYKCEDKKFYFFNLETKTLLSLEPGLGCQINKNGDLEFWPTDDEKDKIVYFSSLNIKSLPEGHGTPLNL